MANSFRFYPEYLGVLARSPGVAAIIKIKTEAAAEEARKLAPVGATGEYRDKIEPEVGLREDGVIGRVNAHHFTSHWIEFGTVKWRSPPAPLRRAVESGAVRNA